MPAFVGVIATTPRVGQNAVLGSLRHVHRGADQYGDARTVGGVLIYTTGSPTEAADALAATTGGRVEFAVIRRRDVVAQAVSWAMAAQSQRFLSSQPSAVTPVYDRDLIARFIDTINADNAAWDEALRSHRVAVRLVYEDDVSDDPSVAAQRILDAWGLPGTAGPTDITRFESELKHQWRQRWEAGR